MCGLVLDLVPPLCVSIPLPTNVQMEDPMPLSFPPETSNNKDHNSVSVMERKLDPHGPGQSLDSSSLQIVSNLVCAQGNRTVILK